MATIHVGTSGYAYPHWRRILYPERLPTRLWLARYAQVFSTLELNTTFYRLPTAETVDHWRAVTPPRFLFAVKGSRFLTHMKRLTETGTGLDRFFSLVRRLGKKLGPVLWQLPPQMNQPDLPRLENFLSHLPRDVRHVFEFRHPVWYLADVGELLDCYGAAFCEHDLVQASPPFVTGGFRYLRFHGATAKYAGRYRRRALRRVAENLHTSRCEAFVYFNNDLYGHAVRDALDLLKLLGEHPSMRAEELGANSP